MVIAEDRNVKANDLGYRPELQKLRLFYYILTFLFFTDYIMPQYFGVHIGFDITCTRFANIIIVLYMLYNSKMLTHFWKMIWECSLTIPIFAYLFVAAYTMVYRVDINALFLVLLEMLTLYMLIYGIRYVIGYKRAIRWSIGCAYFLGIYGLIECACGQSLFLKFLSTVPNSVGNTYRSGHYRIMGPCGHALAYGLLLILFIAMASIDLKKNEVFLFKRPFLTFLLFVNVFLTGSRSTLGIAVFEAVLIICVSNKKNAIKSIMIILGFVTGLALFLLVFYNTSIGQYILMQITSVLDEVLGTEYAALFGAQTTRLENSSEYREVLPLIFTLDWLNPLVGRGVSRHISVQINGIYVESIDNYYVSQYIKYAYPGLFTYILFMLASFGMIIRGIVRYKNAIFKVSLISVFCYFLNLWWLDALQTLKFVYITIAICYACQMVMEEEKKVKIQEEF